MELCHVIILNHDYTLSHKIYSPTEVERGANSMAGPFRFPFMSTAMVALKGFETVLNYAGDDRELKWMVSVVDDLEKKPLFAGSSQARSIFLLGELLDGLAVGFKVIGFDLKAIETDIQASELIVDFTVPKNSSPLCMIGSLMCLMTMFDSLLFARGLLMGDSRLVVEQRELIVGPQCFDGLKQNFQSGL
jgi:hypothetical protein